MDFIDYWNNFWFQCWMEFNVLSFKEKGESMILVYEYIEKQEDVRHHIKHCEGKHTQQAIYSTYHDALTQICFGCKKIRSTIRRNI